MNAQRKLRIVGAFAATSLVSTLLLLACGSDDNPNPGTTVFTIDASGTHTDSSVAPTADAAPVVDSGIADTGPLPDVDAAACTTDAGCWNTSSSCPPQDTTEFLNQCAPGTTCTPFDNTRIVGYDGGPLVFGQ
jgi:hypothetical protein